MAVDIRPANAEDAPWFAARLREADRLELTATSGPDIERSLAYAFELSRGRAFVATSAALGPISLFGFAPYSLMSDKAAPWAVGTDDLRRRGRALNRYGRAYCALALRDFGLLENYVDERHTESIRWLSRIGFDLHPPQAFGREGLPFRRFEMRR